MMPHGCEVDTSRRNSEELIEFNGHERLLCEEGDDSEDIYDDEDLMVLHSHNRHMQDNRL